MVDKKNKKQLIQKKIEGLREKLAEKEKFMDLVWIQFKNIEFTKEVLKSAMLQCLVDWARLLGKKYHWQKLLGIANEINADDQCLEKMIKDAAAKLALAQKMEDGIREIEDKLNSRLNETEQMRRKREAMLRDVRKEAEKIRRHLETVLRDLQDIRNLD